jgi:hypothetical protein
LINQEITCKTGRKSPQRSCFRDKSYSVLRKKDILAFKCVFKVWKCRKRKEKDVEEDEDEEDSPLNNNKLASKQ